MNFEPQKFFIGLMDFFSILLPGGLLTFLLMDEVGEAVIGSRYEVLGDTEGWAIFLVFSYLVGHLMFLLGSWLDEPYDWLRNRTLNRQILLLARNGTLLPRPLRILVWLVFKRERNLAVERAARLKRQVLAPLLAGGAVNTFQWSKALLTIESPESLAVVQRFEADSKFFRSFVVLLLLTAIAWLIECRWLPAGVSIVLLPLALWRYMEQRYKATNQAYWSVITFLAQSGKPVIEKAPSAPGSLTHAGGVVFRLANGQAEYLLVEPKRDPDQWVLPKGHIEEGEGPRETAVREVREETGVWAKICGDLGRVSFQVDGTLVSLQAYLMRAMELNRPTDGYRRLLWLPLADALKKKIHPETRDLLQAAEQMRLQQPKGAE